jgi:hypothetical protein
MISHGHKAVFIHVPKTAGMSMRTYFRRKGFEPVEYHDPSGSNDDKTGVYVNGTSWRIKRNLEDIWNSYFKFAFVRNPWDRMVSCWKNRAKSYDSFDKFLEDYPYPSQNHNLVWHTLPQLTHIQDLDGNMLVDFVGRFENLNNDLKTICESINVEYTPLPHKNKSTHKPYQEYYNQRTQDLVACIYKEEIEMFNYRFDD